MSRPDETTDVAQADLRNDVVDLSKLVNDQANAGASTPSDEDEISAPGAFGRPVVLLVIYCSLIIAASVFGGWLSYKTEVTHTRMQTIISFVGGMMLGIGVFHLLPHAVTALGDAFVTTRWMMAGILMMFAMIRVFHFHNHEPVSVAAVHTGSSCDHDHPGHDHDHDEHLHDHQHDDHQHHDAQSTGEGHSPAVCHTQGHTHGLSWVGIALGLSLHTLIDGVALAASVFRESQSVSGWTLCGLGTFVAIVLHKPLDAVSITSLMSASRWSKKSMRLVNVSFSLMCPLGAFLFFTGLTQFSAWQHDFLGCALAFSAGVFICIALSDLLPEMEFHSHNKVQLTVALVLGITLALAVTYLEPGHLH